MKKQIALILVLAIALAAFSGCGEADVPDPGFDNVLAAVEAVVSTDNMVEMPSEYLENMFSLTSEDYERCIVMSTNVGTTIDEFGLFKGADAAQAEALHTAVQNYLQLRLDFWMPE